MIDLGQYDAVKPLDVDSKENEARWARIRARQALIKATGKTLLELTDKE